MKNNFNYEIMLSVIMPVYNVEKYLRRAIDSVLNQKFNDYEIIIVNDGSTDSSGEICDEYLKKDSRISVIHQENKGLAETRNTALKVARGKYIYFMDSDDYITGEIFSDNIELAEKYGCDEVIFGYVNEICDNTDRVIRRINNPVNMEGLYGFEDLKREYMTFLENVSHCVWNRIYSREIIGDLLFSIESGIAEDAVFNNTILKSGIDRIYFNNKNYHIYVSRENSLMTRFNPRRFDYEMMITDMIGNIVRDWGVEDDFKNYLSKRYIISMLNEYINMTMQECKLSDKEIIIKLKEYYYDDRVDRAKKYVKISDIPYASFKISYALTKCGMYRTALYFRRIYTPCSQITHKILFSIRK